MVTVYFDIDGVLADFDKVYFGKSNETQWRKFDDSKFQEFVDNKQFEKLEQIEVGINLLRQCLLIQEMAHPHFSVQLLGSVASEKFGREFGLEVADQKVKWFQDVFGLYIFENLPVNFVSHKGKKKLFANPKSILLDDCQKNVDEFIEMGGQALLFNMDSEYNETLKTIFDMIENIKQKKDLY